MKILVFIENRDFFGNRLCHLPLLHSLCRSSPEAEVVVLSPYAGAGVFRELGRAHAVEVYGSGLLGLVRRIRRHRPDVAVSLRPASERITVALAAARVPKTVGLYSATGRFLLSDTVPGGTDRYRALKFLSVLKPLEIEGRLDAVFRWLARKSVREGHGPGRTASPDPASPDPASPGPASPNPAADSSTDAASGPASHEGPGYCVMPGGGAGEFKRWGLERFLELCRSVKADDSGATFTWVLGPDEVDYGAAVAKSELAGASRVLLEPSVGELARVCLESRVVVANDCGPSHAAQMAGAPYVGIYSNHDGDARSRLAEWFLPREGARAVVGEPGLPIDRIPVDRVREAVDAVRD